MLVSEQKAAGNYAVQWDGINNEGQKVPSGLYLYRLRAGKFVATRKMMLVE